MGEGRSVLEQLGELNRWREWASDRSRCGNTGAAVSDETLRASLDELLPSKALPPWARRAANPLDALAEKLRQIRPGIAYFDDPRGRQSEELAFRAEQAQRAGDREAAGELYRQAAVLETEVARSIPSAEHRIRGVIAVSAVALWRKAGDLAQAAEVAAAFLADEHLPADEREVLEALQRGAKLTPAN